MICVKYHEQNIYLNSMTSFSKVLLLSYSKIMLLVASVFIQTVIQIAGTHFHSDPVYSINQRRQFLQCVYSI